MKDKIRAILIMRPEISFVDLAKELGYDPQANKNVRIAYWQARALLMEEIYEKDFVTVVREKFPIREEEDDSNSSEIAFGPLAKKREISIYDFQEEQMAYVYLIDNKKNWKGYVGCTNSSLAKRFGQHKHLLRRGSHTNHEL